MRDKNFEMQSENGNNGSEAVSGGHLVSREYKDRLFKFIFGNPENREWTLSLYNAVNDSHYEDANDIEFTTIENAVYVSMKNDVSFLIENIMNLYEQQSTFNPNMPMRYLIYSGMVYSKFIKTSKYRMYSPSQQKAPTPKCICFYNGLTDADDRTILKLSDSFEKSSDPDIEVRVTMININYGHNKKLLDACRPLKECAWFVEQIRVNQKTMKPLEEAVDAAIDMMDEDAYIRPFLIVNRAEVKLMCITEYDEAKLRADDRADGYEAGLEKGMKQGREEGMVQGHEKGKIDTLVSLVKSGLLSLTVAAEQAEMTAEEFEAAMNAAK